VWLLRGLGGVFAIAAGCCLAACGSSGQSGTTRSNESSKQAPAVSSNPFARQVDADCAQVMPDVRAAVREASGGAIDPATAARVVSELQTLDTVTLDVLRQYAPPAPPPPKATGPWHATQEFLLAAFQYAAYGGSSATPAQLAAHVVQQSHVVSGNAAAAQIPDCESDPPGSALSQPVTSSTAPTSPPPQAPSSTTPSSTRAMPTAPPPCNSSHNAYFRCATAAAPYCEQGQCSYPAPASGPCAPGYRRTLVPSTSAFVCQKDLGAAP